MNAALNVPTIGAPSEKCLSCSAAAANQAFGDSIRERVRAAADRNQAKLIEGVALELSEIDGKQLGMVPIAPALKVSSNGRYPIATGIAAIGAFPA